MVLGSAPGILQEVSVSVNDCACFIPPNGTCTDIVSLVCSLCIGLKVDRAVELAKDAVANGMCAVIGLQSTGESHTARSVGADEGTDDFISAPHEVLKGVIFKLFW